MIKAAGRTGDTPLVLLGLSGENMTRLMADEPIWIDLAELGLPPTVVLIVGGRTEDDIMAQLHSAGLADVHSEYVDQRKEPREVAADAIAAGRAQPWSAVRGGNGGVASALSGTSHLPDHESDGETRDGFTSAALTLEGDPTTETGQEAQPG